jgi:hypothetical protein
MRHKLINIIISDSVPHAEAREVIASSVPKAPVLAVSRRRLWSSAATLSKALLAERKVTKKMFGWILKTDWDIHRLMAVYRRKGFMKNRFAS